MERISSRQQLQQAAQLHWPSFDGDADDDDVLSVAAALMMMNW